MPDEPTPQPKRRRNSPSDRPEAVRARVRKHRINNPPNRAYCTVCGGVLRRGGLSEKFGFHQKCDRAWFQALYRESKRSR